MKARDIITACLDENPLKRPEFSEIIQELEQLNFQIMSEEIPEDDVVDMKQLSEILMDFDTVEDFTMD